MTNETTSLLSKNRGEAQYGAARLGLKVPLAIGTLQWGTTWIDDKIVNRTGCITEEMCESIVDAITEAGVTLIDTAEGYGGGTSEKRLGRLFHNTTTMEARKNVVFMTKFIPVPWRGFHSNFEWAVRHSCERLKVDSIPIYLLHSPVHWRPIE
jgi:aryl-alcohol dehydrogenase-like predicted oxidoreductase